MRSPVNALQLARDARARGLASTEGGTEGLADLGILQVRGPDAATFLHSQFTNDVSGLNPGEGNLSARVTRTGHLSSVMSVHSLPDQDEPTFLLVLERTEVQTLLNALDLFHFSEKLTLTDVSEKWSWLCLQGPSTTDLARTVFGELEGLNWDEFPEYGIRSLASTPWAGGRGEGGWILRRDLSGDVGIFVAISDQSEVRESLVEALAQAAAAADVPLLDPDAYNQVLEVLRIEGGQIRPTVDMPGKARLLPETGLEQVAVSYTKGCYLGQEVIARVRTYGSVPHALRGLVLQVPEGAQADEVLARLPGAGEKLVLDTGETVGQIVAQCTSPVTEGPIATAYLNRDSRTPGTELTFAGDVHARVQLLPFYRVSNREARVAHLYDRAIRIFAKGDENTALQLLEQTLRLDPGFTDGYEAIGLLLGKAGRYHEAIDFFRRLEDIAPDEPMVNTNLSLYYMKIGDKQTAEDQAGLATTKKFRQTKWQDRSAAEIAQEQTEGLRKDALRKQNMFKQVLEIDPVDGIALFGLGNALSILGSWSEAAETYARAVQSDPKNSAIYLAWGKALEQTHQSDEAIDVYRRGMDMASQRGDLMPLKEMEHRVLLLSATQA